MENGSVTPTSARETEIGATRVRIAGHYPRGAGLIASGSSLMNERTLLNVVTVRSSDEVSFGLIRLEPGAKPDEVAERLRAEMPEDVEVLTRADA